MQQRATQGLLGGSMGVSNKDKIEVLTEFAEKLSEKAWFYGETGGGENEQFYIDCTEVVYYEIRHLEDEIELLKKTKVYNAILDVYLGDHDCAYEWLTTEIPALGYKRPIDCDEDDVLRTIKRIETGVFI